MPLPRIVRLHTCVEIQPQSFIGPRDGFGGVIQYDLGKKLQNGRFQKTGQLNASPDKLLGVIPEMRRLYSDKKKPDRLAEHLQRLDDMEDYQRPAVDRLTRQTSLMRTEEIATSVILSRWWTAQSAVLTVCSCSLRNYCVRKFCTQGR